MSIYDKQFKEEAVRLAFKVGTKKAAQQLGISFFVFAVPAHKMLIDISKTEAGYSVQLKNVNMRLFLNDLYSQINALASVKQLKTEFDGKYLPDIISIDASLMQRAIINAVSNAVDYSPQYGNIWLCVYAKTNKIKIYYYR